MKRSRAALFAILIAATATVSAIEPRPAQSIPAVPALPAMASEGAVTSAGAKIWFGTVGKGPPVILLHGGLSSSRGWGAQVPALVDAGYRVILIDSRGHGRSTLGTQPLSYELMARDVTAVMDRLALRRAAIVGWSDGAIIGLVLAMHHGRRVDRLYAFGANMDQQGVREGADQAPILQEVGPRLAADHAELSRDARKFATLHQTVRTMQKSQPRYRASQLAAIRGVSVTIADGAQDEFITEPHAAYLARVIPAATLEIFPNAGHFAPWQDAATFNRALLAFLGKGAPPSPA
jgi:pimeloyl-ACP methyl ester carboxylesterase